MTERGKFIVIEGTDGSGKGSQIDPLSRYLTQTDQPHRVIDFPRYTDNAYGRLVGDYLKGSFGRLMDVHPCLAALPYAGDRLLAKPLIEGWLSEGSLVIANRYTPSNAAFMAAKLPVCERADYIEWLENLEYGVNKIPREDMVVLLNVTPDIGTKNVDRKDERVYMGGKGRDIHERDLDYQRRVLGVYLDLARSRRHWRVIECVKDGELLGVFSIHILLTNLLRHERVIS